MEARVIETRNCEKEADVDTPKGSVYETPEKRYVKLNRQRFKLIRKRKGSSKKDSIKQLSQSSNNLQSDSEMSEKSEDKEDLLIHCHKLCALFEDKEKEQVILKHEIAELEAIHSDLVDTKEVIEDEVLRLSAELEQLYYEVKMLENKKETLVKEKHTKSILHN